MRRPLTTDAGGTDARGRCSCFEARRLSTALASGARPRERRSSRPQTAAHRGRLDVLLCPRAISALHSSVYRLFVQVGRVPRLPTFQSPCSVTDNALVSSMTTECSSTTGQSCHGLQHSRWVVPEPQSTSTDFQLWRCCSKCLRTSGDQPPGCPTDLPSVIDVECFTRYLV